MNLQPLLSQSMDEGEFGVVLWWKPGRSQDVFRQHTQRLSDWAVYQAKLDNGAAENWDCEAAQFCDQIFIT